MNIPFMVDPTVHNVVWIIGFAALISVGAMLVILFVKKFNDWDEVVITLLRILALAAVVGGTVGLIISLTQMHDIRYVKSVSEKGLHEQALKIYGINLKPYDLSALTGDDGLGDGTIYEDYTNRKTVSSVVDFGEDQIANTDNKILDVTLVRTNKTYILVYSDHDTKELPHLKK
jgi:hypothetical protein